MTPSQREWLIVNTLETIGEASLRQLGRQTNLDHATLLVDLDRLVDVGKVERETMPLVLHFKSPRHVWRLP